MLCSGKGELTLNPPLPRICRAFLRRSKTLVPYSGYMAAEPVNVNEFQELAKQALPKMYYDYFSGGAEDQFTLNENMEAFKRITIRPRVLVDVSKLDISTAILGYKTSSPIMIAPTGMQGLAHPEGEIATARAAAACDTIMVLSFSSSYSLEEVASSCNAVRFFQLYVYKRRDVSALMVQRAERNGFKAIIVTVDTPKLGRREADIKNRMITPPLSNLKGLISNDVVSDKGSNLEAFASATLDPSLSWKDIAWLKSITNLPVLIKGVLTCEDALKAMEVGVAGIIVSNHGARQLDYSPATITVLEEVVHAVEGRIPVILDGGIRRGTDVFKALALGAQAVMIGRPVVYGLAAKGQDGVERVVKMLKDELELTMALAGCCTVNEISRFHFSSGARPVSGEALDGYKACFLPQGRYKMGSEPVNVNEFQDLAKQALPKMAYDYFAGGAEGEYTLKENVEAFKRISIHPRVLVDVSKIDMSTTVLGYKISSPIMIAPTGSQKLAHPEGEVATARAAAACNTIMVMSFSSSFSVEEVSSSCNAVCFFQLYVFKRREVSALLVRRAERNGFKAIVVTVDNPRLGRREADLKNRLILPPKGNLKGLMNDDGSKILSFAPANFDASLSWKDMTWLKSITNLPVLIKGVLTAEDAIKAVEVGAAGIIVSNHGGRQLDYTPATITVLEEVVHAVAGKIPVLFDGGVRRGTDVFKAVALGARAVLIGRPVVYGLTVTGQQGVEKVVGMLKEELELTMALAGCCTIKDITRHHVRTEHDKLQCRM